MCPTCYHGFVITEKGNNYSLGHGSHFNPPLKLFLHFFLVQTQEFQTVANGLGRWMDGMQGGMGHQGHIAARVKLIEVQIEGFKVCVCVCVHGGIKRSASESRLEHTVGSHYPNMQGPRDVQITEMLGISETMLFVYKAETISI